MDSLLGQTHRPAKITAVEDGSSDGTGEILDEFEKRYPDMVRVIHTGSSTRDYARLPKLWNMGLEKGFDYHMIASGDAVFEADFAEKIIKRMEADPNLAVTGGDYTGNAGAPHGTGRFVRQSWFFSNYNEYPQIIGYESEILFRAMLNGYGVKVFHDARFEHTEKLGQYHNFVEFGWAMRSLGYHPLYALARCMLSWFGSDMGKRSTLNMLRAYLTFRPDASGYYSRFPEKTRKMIRDHQRDTILRWMGLKPRRSGQPA